MREAAGVPTASWSAVATKTRNAIDSTDGASVSQDSTESLASQVSLIVIPPEFYLCVWRRIKQEFLITLFAV